MQIVVLSHDCVESAVIHKRSKETPKEILVVTELPLPEKCNILSGQFWKQSVLEHFFYYRAIQIIHTN